MRIALFLLLACSAPPISSTQDANVSDAGGGSDAITQDSGDPNRFTDPRDGVKYRTVTLGAQTWFAENLRYVTPNGSLCYGGNPASCDTYGRLYTLDAALTACPSQWHLPSDDDWKVLEETLGMSAAARDLEGYSVVRGTDEGTKLKVGGETSFDLLMAGYASGTLFDAMGDRTYLWTSTKVGTQAYRRRVAASTPTVFRFLNPIATFAISVRCLKD